MFGGSGGIVVVSSCLDGPRVHRPADSAWMEARADSRLVTGAGATKLAASNRRARWSEAWTHYGACRTGQRCAYPRAEEQHPTRGRSATV